MRTDYAIILVALFFLALAIYLAILVLNTGELPFKTYILVLSTALLLSSVFLLVFMTAVFGSKKTLYKAK